MFSRSFNASDEKDDFLRPKISDMEQMGHHQKGARPRNQHHDPEFHFCPICGGEVETRVLKGNEPSRPVCLVCGHIHYLDPKVVACAIVEDHGKIVLVKRGINPQRGKWVLPGGYVDRGEEVDKAAIRETFEECGIKVEIVNLVGVYSYAGQLPVVIVYVAHFLSGDLVPRDETIEARLFSEEEIPWKDLGFQSTVDALRDYMLCQE